MKIRKSTLIPNFIGISWGILAIVLITQALGACNHVEKERDTIENTSSTIYTNQ